MIAKIIIYLCCAYVAFVCGAGFLFGQLFTGYFSLGPTIAGLAGILAVCLVIYAREIGRKKLTVTLVALIICLLGIGMDVYEYYSKDHSSGNYYAWFMIGPCAVALVYLILAELFSKDFSTPP